VAHEHIDWFVHNTGADTLGLAGLSVTVEILAITVLRHFRFCGAWHLKQTKEWFGYRGELKKDFWVGILKGPRKLVLCCLIIARELPRGTHLPWIPTLCTDELYKMGGEKVRVNPTWVKTPGFHQTAHIYKLSCENWTAHIQIYWESESCGCENKTKQGNKNKTKIKQRF